MTDWLPVLTLADGEAYFPNAAFQQEVVLEVLLEIAAELQACIIGQDGEVYFAPELGLLWDERSGEAPLFESIDELRRFRHQHGSTAGYAARQLMQQRGW